MEDQADYKKIERKSLSLFDTEQESIKLCWICNKNPFSKNGKGVLWNGFRDKEMNVLVCFSPNCREEHYKRKGETDYKNLYSEFPEQY